MQVIIYQQPEMADTLFDNENIERYNQLIDELGLQHPKADSKSPCPYPKMSTNVQEVFKYFCPLETEVTDFTEEPIPLELLERIHHARHEGYFDKIYIWHSRSDKDPLVVGFIFADEECRQKNYTWRGKRFLIGRWGDMMKPFKQLYKIAAEGIRKKRIAEMEKTIADAQRDLKTVDHFVGDLIGFSEPAFPDGNVTHVGNK